MNKARFEAASDGVFAIAITLLVLGLAVPVIQPAQDGRLADLAGRNRVHTIFDGSAGSVPDVQNIDGDVRIDIIRNRRRI